MWTGTVSNQGLMNDVKVLGLGMSLPNGVGSLAFKSLIWSGAEVVGNSTQVLALLAHTFSGLHAP